MLAQYLFSLIINNIKYAIFQADPSLTFHPFSCASSFVFQFST